jgi:hypothetical protein
VTEKSLLADAVQLSLGRRGQKAITAIQANPESQSGSDGAGGQSYHSSTQAGQQL